MGISPALLHVQQVEDPAAFARTALIDVLKDAEVTVDEPATAWESGEQAARKGARMPRETRSRHTSHRCSPSTSSSS